MILEACVETLEGALNAQISGANRIELCSRLDLDGLTPSPEMIQKACAKLSIPVMVMIRPRGGNFVYTPQEIETMLCEIETVKSLGAAGVVFGLLTPENEIDIENSRKLARAAQPLQITFHKAIDLLPNPVEGVKILKKIGGIHRILTSGGKETAEQGAQILREMVEVGKPEIAIIAAGKVTAENVTEIANLTNAVEFHGKKIVENIEMIE